MARTIDIKNLQLDHATFTAAVDACTHALKAGGIVCIPTDSVYGLAAATPAAAEKISILKGRPLAKKFPLLISGVDDLLTYAQNTTPAARALAHAFWPGALTLVVEASDAVPLEFMEEDGSVALRVADASFAQALIKNTGPLATTSANLHKKDPAVRLEDLDPVLLEAVDIAVDGGQTREQQASTIVDVREDAAAPLLSHSNSAVQHEAAPPVESRSADVRILRLGSITEQDIWGVIRASNK